VKTHRICAVITNTDIKPVREVEPLVDLFEVRIDLIGEGWTTLVKQLSKPWIACNRSEDEGGRWGKDEASRIDELYKATNLGASIIDIELKTKNLVEILSVIKPRAKCLLSFHELVKTPPISNLKEIVNHELSMVADIGKVVTAAQRFEDNLTVLHLISAFPKARLVSFAIGPLGALSRVLCSLVGGDFTYASIEEGKESAAGQLTVKTLRKIYELI
jgi:3-dehydroquinate dehydratase-1